MFLASVISLENIHWKRRGYKGNIKGIQREHKGDTKAAQKEYRRNIEGIQEEWGNVKGKWGELNGDIDGIYCKEYEGNVEVI